MLLVRWGCSEYLVGSLSLARNEHATLIWIVHTCHSPGSTDLQSFLSLAFTACARQRGTCRELSSPPGRATLKATSTCLLVPSHLGYHKGLRIVFGCTGPVAHLVASLQVHLETLEATEDKGVFLDLLGQQAIFTLRSLPCAVRVAAFMMKIFPDAWQ